MEIDIKLPLCEGYGFCAETAPEIYEIDDEGYARLRLDGPPTSEQEPAAEAGARVCPVAAIAVSR
jgi:ferredoxin